MIVYVLSTYWDTEDNEGNEVLGIYSEENLEKARNDMLACADAVKEMFPADVWQDDFTWEYDDEIHLGFDPQIAFCNATIYSWEITKHEVQ